MRKVRKVKEVRKVRSLAASVLAIVLAACGRSGPSSPAPVTVRPVLEEQASGTTALLQAVSAVNDSVVWVSGHRATFARTSDGGRTWQARSWTDADSVLEFRDVHAVSYDTAYLLAAGPGERSRIYKTTDGGNQWLLQFLNSDSAAFYDCFDFWDATHGIVVSDAVRGRMIVMTTEDGVQWRDASAGLPPALEGEGAFAASGTCLVTRSPGLAWFVTGAPAGTRVYRTEDRGRTWSVTALPMVSGAATGAATAGFRDERHGLALGGRLADNEDRSVNVARTSDGGRTWVASERTSFPGAVFGSSYVPRLGAAIVAVGPRGLAWSGDDGLTWTTLSDRAYWAVDFASPLAGWAVGPAGRITRLTVPR